MKYLAQIGTACGLMLASYPAWAKEGDSEKLAPTLFLDATYGFATYKSEAVASNDMGSQFSYALGGHAGEDKQFSFQVKSDTDNTTFLLNDSAVTSVWQESHFRYRFGYLYVGALFSQLSLKVKREGEEAIDVSGSGYGGSLGMVFPISRIGAYYLDVSQASVGTFHNTLDEEVSAGARLDIDTGARFALTKNLVHLLVGYRNRTFTVTSSTAFKEMIYTTYLGFRFAWFF
jgi:hypothetical protein